MIFDGFKSPLGGIVLHQSVDAIFDGRGIGRLRKEVAGVKRKPRDGKTGRDAQTGGRRILIRNAKQGPDSVCNKNDKDKT